MKKTSLSLLALGVLMVAACKNSSEYKVASNADTVNMLADTTQAKLVKTAGINFKVKDVKGTSLAVSASTKKYGGMVIHQNITSEVGLSQDIPMGDDSLIRVSSVRSAADITVKVPTANLEAFMEDVTKGSVYIAEQKFDIEDKSFDYLSAAMKLQSRNQIISQQKAGKVIIKNPSAVMDLKDDMIDQKINNLRIDDAVKFSVVALHCYQSNIISRETIVNDDPAAYKAPFWLRARIAIINGYHIFLEMFLGILNLWMLILAGVVSWLIYKHYWMNKRTGVTK